jgi:hypothetical protein
MYSQGSTIELSTAMRNSHNSSDSFSLLILGEDNVEVDENDRERLMSYADDTGSPEIARNTPANYSCISDR